VSTQMGSRYTGGPSNRSISWYRCQKCSSPPEHDLTSEQDLINEVVFLSEYVTSRSGVLFCKLKMSLPLREAHFWSS